MNNQQMLIATITAVGCLNIASAAQAGEGGIAAAAAFHLDSSGKVTDIAVAAGIGKTSAAAGAELNYSSVLTSTSFNSLGLSETSNNSSNSGYGGCCYYYYGSGSSTSTSINSSINLSSSTSTYQPVTSVKAFAVGSAGSLSYNSGGGYYYYYGGGSSIYVSGEDPASVGTAQANTFNLNVLSSGVGLTP